MQEKDNSAWSGRFTFSLRNRKKNKTKISETHCPYEIETDDKDDEKLLINSTLIELKNTLVWINN